VFAGIEIVKYDFDNFVVFENERICVHAVDRCIGSICARREYRVQGRNLRAYISLIVDEGTKGSQWSATGGMPMFTH